eukprot:gnl/TRDRNA2_/TRDRNA2_162454_c0_seq3.p1 gnl/TRDRNA2_/TRDRNA2_162454_c0~~gnl/TRDRNA2_/TRDRNA2_162454_c0_seq3.p1  ORF type:complete len:144 (+),score=3.56 gnl/TRDRNA2_/TRDRNA2_162454_c0_seq3:105-536(+)
MPHRNVLDDFLAGCIAGAGGTLVTHPLDTLVLRLQSTSGLSAVTTAAIAKEVQTTLRLESSAAFLRGSTVAPQKRSHVERSVVSWRASCTHRSSVLNAARKSTASQRAEACSRQNSWSQGTLSLTTALSTSSVAGGSWPVVAR